MYIKRFNEISKNDIQVAGGKGANLGEMSCAGMSVPGGFVLTADAYRLFVKENGYEESFTDILKEAGSDEQKLTEAAGKLRSLILSGNIPNGVMDELNKEFNMLCPAGKGRVAVRSSATAEDLAEASFAGQQETYLGLKGIDQVSDAIRKCYASLWGNRATIYRNNLGFDQNEVALAVVIQLMIDSDKAGVLFTVDPVTNDRDKIRINSSYGLGESVVSGRVTADSVLCKKDGTVISCELGSKLTKIIYDDNLTREVSVSDEDKNRLSLNEDEIKRLCLEGLKIEEHYGKPMDIEWAISDSQIYILQARPVTTIKESPTDDEADIIQSYISGSRISGPAKSNMAFQLEKMPYAYRPLDYDIILQINHQKANIFAEAGLILTSDPQIDDDGIMTLPDPHKSISKNIVKFPAVFKEVRNFENCAKVCDEFMPGYEKELSGYTDIDYDSLSLKECTDLLESSYDLLGKLCYDRFKYALFPSVLGGDLTRAVKKIDKKLTNYDLLKDLDNKTSVVTRDVAALALQISENRALTDDILAGNNYEKLCRDHPDITGLFSDFMKKNGFKSDFNCYCVEAKTLIEDPDRLISIIRPLLGTDGYNAPNDNDHTGFDEILTKLKEIYGNKYPALRTRIEAFRTFHLVREESQYLWEMLFYYIRRILKRLSLLLTENDDYIHGIANLFYPELIAACRRGSLNESDREKMTRRNEKHSLSQKVWDASKLLVFDSKGDSLKGISGSNGVVVGNVCIVRSPAEFHKMKNGDILVCELTDPEWTPLFRLAAGVVADTGSSLSHAAIVAREFGIPAVLGVGFATSRFKDGDMIRVDGDKGIVSAC